ncbi:type II toxin-antitoxin system HicB family antitoxin [Rhizobium leguminosarum]|uniref:type II toxin-antitoxin system HicB family antitoxin n=1 Tax=Rhizobium leguminosarum TaxID=384 RepID=UPI001C95E044|nr:type II toxin-antitoxin system HicB family antitoxin [Rhizobium leguminosarum]MBY5590810.1 type II toxin-antitoxin system HicB family antitoxin [Rhizobium leguminosarum]MBY5606336.1 type II toxin-antitoxin system HicB family antitoxin [Rhizobium leguminosarum]
MKTVKYKDYQASVEFDDGKLFVKVLHIDDLLLSECDSASEAEGVLAELIEDYLLDCAEIGKEPCKPFKGSLNVRIAPDLHRRAAMSAADEGQTLNAWISSAISEKVECTRLSDRIDGVFSKKQQEVTARAYLHNTHDIAAGLKQFNYRARYFQDDEPIVARAEVVRVIGLKRQMHG